MTDNPSAVRRHKGRLRSNGWQDEQSQEYVRGPDHDEAVAALQRELATERAAREKAEAKVDAVGEVRSKPIAKAIIDNLLDRSGIGNALEECDDDIREEILDTISNIIDNETWKQLDAAIKERA